MVRYWIWNFECLTFSSCSALCNLFLSFCSRSFLVTSCYLMILASNSCWCLSRALSNFSAFSFAISVSFLALPSSNTSLLILFSRALTLIPESFYKDFASSISIPSFSPFLPPVCTTLRDLDVFYLFNPEFILAIPPLMLCGLSD